MAYPAIEIWEVATLFSAGVVAEALNAMAGATILFAIAPYIRRVVERYARNQRKKGPVAIK
jgi:hypothetical protein